MLGIGGVSPSDHVGNVRAAAITAPSMNASSPLDNRPANMNRAHGSLKSGFFQEATIT